MYSAVLLYVPVMQVCRPICCSMQLIVLRIPCAMTLFSYAACTALLYIAQTHYSRPAPGNHG